MSKVDDLLMEPEFKKGGFVWKHIESKSPDPLRSVQSAVDRMRDLHDIDDREFDPLCQNILTRIQQSVDKS